LAGARPEFALSAPPALERVKAIAEPSLILILSDRCDLAIKGAVSEFYRYRTSTASACFYRAVLVLA